MLFGASCGATPRDVVRGRTRAIVLALIALPAVAAAQEPARDTTARTHTVKRGDTLWDIARTYLNDPFQWPEIYRLNRQVVENPHWIYPGEVLVLPSAAAVAAAPDPTEEPAAPAAEAPRQAPSATVFTRVAPAAAPSRVFSDAAIEAGPAVRPGEILAAPWADRDGGPAGAGKVIESAELRRGDRGGENGGQLQLYEEVLVTLPAGSSSAVGTRLLAFVPGEAIRDLGQPNPGRMMYPAAVLDVIRAPAAGESAVARVTRLFGQLRPGVRLIPYDSAMLRAGGDATIQLGDAGPVTEVRWVWRGQPLPSKQSYILLDAGEREGVHVGDEFTIFRPRTAARDDRDPDAPALSIATAQVVRVTSLGSTAIVIGHKLPAIETGMKARATARVP